MKNSPLQLVPLDLARKYRVFPVSIQDNGLKILCPPDTSRNLVNDLQFITGRWIQTETCDSSTIHELMERNYGELSNPTSTSTDSASLTFKSFSKNDNSAETQLRQEVEKTPIVKLVNKLITNAINMGASDIHLEPSDRQFKVRYRLDGMLKEMESIPQEKRLAVISRIKVMAEMDIAERRRPQDGRVRVEGENKIIDIRVSTLPTDFGEKVVLRILDKTSLQLTLENLGFDQKSLDIFKEKIKLPYGMILVTGPTGSGKTTSLYAGLNHIKNPSINIITIEEPIEYNLEGISQCQVKPEIDFTFANALRTFLRQDPNVIMVGEIRDNETMEIAIRAALTGHLVLSTLHTNDAATSITRLLDMGAEPFLVSSSVTLVMAQRLVRRLCSKCKQECKPDEKLLQRLKMTQESITFYEPTGCPYCNYTGYKGRTAVFEIMPISPEIAELVNQRATANQISIQAQKEGMITLREDAIRKLKQGITSIEEILRETVEGAEQETQIM